MLILMSKVIQLLAELKCESNLSGSEAQALNYNIMQKYLFLKYIR